MNILNIDNKAKRWLSMIIDLIFMWALILLSKSSFINEILSSILGIAILVLLVKVLYSATKIILSKEKLKKEKK